MARPPSWRSGRGERIDRHGCHWTADKDPSQLLFDVAAALRSAGLSRGPKSMTGHLNEHTAISLGVSRVIRMIEPSDERGVLILDHMEKARSRAVNDVIAELVHRLDGRLQVAVASRKKIRLPIGVWRSEGRLLEIGPAELRMDETEADALLRGMDVVVEQLPDLVERTEGCLSGSTSSPGDSL
jgi:LuxR family maltose regulon positive regulatory protein